MRRTAICLAVLSCGLALATPELARADVATAEALFREGRMLLEQGELEAACAKLAESQAQDPSSGTLINLALCHEKQGKVATAWAEYEAAARLARYQDRADRAMVAEQRAAQIEPRVPHMRFGSSERVPGRKLTLNGSVIGEAALDSPLPLNPGHYELVISAPGFESRSVAFDIAEGEQSSVLVPPLQPAKVLIPAPARQPTPPVRLVDDRPRERHGASPTLVAAVLGTGTAVLATGIAFGAISAERYAHAERLCPSHRDCSPDAMHTRRTAETTAWIANFAIAGGLAGSAVGLWLALRRPSGHEVARLSTEAVPGGGGLTLSRRF